MRLLSTTGALCRQNRRMVVAKTLHIGCGAYKTILLTNKLSVLKHSIIYKNKCGKTISRSVLGLMILRRQQNP